MVEAQNGRAFRLGAIRRQTIGQQVFLKFFRRRIEPLLSVRRFAEKCQGHDTEGAPFHDGMVGMVARARDRWRAKPFHKIFSANADEIITYLVLFGDGEAIESRIVAHRHAFEQP